MKRTYQYIPHSRLIQLLQIAKDATQGTWAAKSYQGHECVTSYSPHESREEIIADCVKDGHSGFKSSSKHVLLFETFYEADAVYISNFNPEVAKRIIKELMRISEDISKISTMLDKLHHSKITHNLIKQLHAINEANSSNDQLIYLQQLAETATPGPYNQTFSKGKYTNFIQTLWKYDFNKCVKNKKYSQIAKINLLNEVNYGFKIYENGIYLCQTVENQHYSNSKYVSAFNPTLTIPLIKKIHKYREIVLNVICTLGYTKLSILGDDFINEIHEVAEMAQI